MAQADVSSPAEPPQPGPNFKTTNNLLRKLFGRQSILPEPADAPPEPDRDQSQNQDDGSDKSGLIRRVSRKVVPGLPRVQTFKRQQSERRNNLAPVQPTSAERRAVSEDRRAQLSGSALQTQSCPRTSAPDVLDHEDPVDHSVPSLPASPFDGPAEEAHGVDGLFSQGAANGAEYPFPAAPSTADAQSMTTSQYDAVIHDELEHKWILNLSMHFRDKSKREKFFVTYRERATVWRRVTISLDYRNAPESSLELELQHTKFQREKSAKIYEAIRDSLQDIQFYDTVTNLKLQTTDGRLHVHVVEDVNEIVHYPTVRQVQHLGCQRVRERDIRFNSHLSGFVYKVNVNAEVLIKKEIPGPDTIDEFLYEINALNRLRHSTNVIRFYGVVVDDDDAYVKGLLVSFAERGALVDVIYDSRQEHDDGIPWPTRQRWARQIVQGLSDIHEAGFVQGDFTLSNIVIDDLDDAKIIDINRRGCPVGWEPPEVTPLIKCNQRISMYIGVKSDLYQLGMVLWALATQEDEPEAQGRPLMLGPEINVPDWYRRMVEICLSDDPCLRLQASLLISMFPRAADGDWHNHHLGPSSISVDEAYPLPDFFMENCYGGAPRIRTVEPPADWSHVSLGHTYVDPTLTYHNEPYYYTRGRSPPSPLPSHSGRFDSPHSPRGLAAWAAHRDIAPSYSDAGLDEGDHPRSVTPTTNKESIAPSESIDDATKRLQRESSENQSAIAQSHHNTDGATTEPTTGEHGETARPGDLKETVNPEEVAQGQDGSGPQGLTEDLTASKIEGEGEENKSPTLGAAGITAPAIHANEIEENKTATESGAVISPPGHSPDKDEMGMADVGPTTAVDVDPDAREATPRPLSTPPLSSSSPAAELLELKGVGGAYNEVAPEEMQADISLDDDFDAMIATTETQP